VPPAVSFDPESTLRPLRQRASDVDALRAGAPAAALVVRVARAAETTLRRMLRDDPTAPVELRLRALSADDLSTPDLLAELRRRNRLPMELAAAFHDLDLACERISGGADPGPRDATLAVHVADELQSHILSLPAQTPLEDPVIDDPDDTVLVADDEELVHAVPPSRRRRITWESWAALAVLAILLVIAIRMRGGDDDDALRRGEAALRAGRVAEAEAAFRAHADENERDPRPRVYLARLYREAGRYPDAEREIQAGLRADSADAGLQVERGYLLLDQGRAVDAVPVFRQAVLADSASRRAWAGLVRSLRASGRPAEAERVLRRAPADLRAMMRTADAQAADSANAVAPAPIP
jgi:tetratricopeptide (TPR) repeat protein